MANVQHFDSDGATQITQQNWADAFSGQIQTPKKFGVRNISDRPLGGVAVTIEIQQAVPGNDGHLQLRLADEAATLPGPWGVSAVAQSGTGSFVLGGTKGYRVTSVSAIGESTSAMEATVALPSTGSVVALSWIQVVGAVGYRVYRTDVPGTYGSTSFLTVIGSGAQISMVDGGGPLATGSPAADNRTAGWLTTLVLSAPGAGGVWGATGTRFYRVAAVDATGAIIAASLEASVNVDNTTKTVTISWVAGPFGTAAYRVYRTVLAGSYISPALIATVSAPGTNFVDIGSAATPGQLVASPSYGLPPATASFVTNPLIPGSSLAINQTVFYWVNRVVPLATPEAGNPRQAFVVIKEA